MCAEGNLYNPTLFAPASAASTPTAFTYDGGLYLPHADLALEYVEIVKGLKTRTPLSAVKGHLFKILRPGLARELDLRTRMGKIKANTLEPYVEIIEELKQRMEVRSNLYI